MYLYIHVYNLYVRTTWATGAGQVWLDATEREREYHQQCSRVTRLVLAWLRRMSDAPAVVLLLWMKMSCVPLVLRQIKINANPWMDYAVWPLSSVSALRDMSFQFIKVCHVQTRHFSISLEARVWVTNIRAHTHTKHNIECICWTRFYTVEYCYYYLNKYTHPGLVRKLLFRIKEPWQEHSNDLQSKNIPSINCIIN